MREEFAQRKGRGEARARACSAVVLKRVPEIVHQPGSPSIWDRPAPEATRAASITDSAIVSPTSRQPGAGPIPEIEPDVARRHAPADRRRAAGAVACAEGTAIRSICDQAKRRTRGTPKVSSSRSSIRPGADDPRICSRSTIATALRTGRWRKRWRRRAGGDRPRRRTGRAGSSKERSGHRRSPRDAEGEGQVSSAGRRSLQRRPERDALLGPVRHVKAGRSGGDAPWARSLHGGSRRLGPPLDRAASGPAAPRSRRPARAMG